MAPYGTQPGSRTQNILILSQSPLPIGLVGHLVPQVGLEPTADTLEECCTSNCATGAYKNSLGKDLHLT